MSADDEKENQVLPPEGPTPPDGDFEPDPDDEAPLHEETLPTLPSTSERETLLARAREPRPFDALEAERASRMKRGQQAAALEQLMRTVEWRVFAELARSEQEHYEFDAMDPNELMAGTTVKRIAGIAPEGPSAGNPSASAPVVSPVDGWTWVLKRTFLQGAAWGAQAILSFPERFIDQYVRSEELKAKTARVVLGQDGKPIARRGRTRDAGSLGVPVP